MNIPKGNYLFPLLCLSLSGNSVLEETKAYIDVSTTCDLEENLRELLNGERLSVGESVTVVLAAGPNRDRNRDAAIELTNSLIDNEFQTSFHMRADQGDVNLAQHQIEIGRALDTRVKFSVHEEEMGTSYTEVVDALRDESSNHMFFLAHNRPHKLRLSLAAHGAREHGVTSDTLKGVHILCHDQDPLKPNFLKETVSLLVDHTHRIIWGHDDLVDFSRGGGRLAKFKDAVSSIIP